MFIQFLHLLAVVKLDHKQNEQTNSWNTIIKDNKNEDICTNN